MMGICHSVEVEEDKKKVREAQATSTSIERTLKAAGKSYVQKLLLLGPAESGKSTVLKQIVILHKNGFTVEEMESRKGAIYSNIVLSMTTILRAMDKLDIPLTGDLKDAELILSWVDSNQELEPLTHAVALAIKRLWINDSVQYCFNRRNEYQLNDSAKYFIEAVDRISSRDFVPSEQDMLCTRMQTTGVVELRFRTKDIDFRVFDVGGQRSERRKWIHFFDDVNAVIFVAAVSEYDQKLREDDTTNRVQEALTLFGDICNHEYFSQSSMVVFLNKTDLFRSKIQTTSLNVLFTDYTGGLNYENGISYLRGKFDAQNETPGRRLYMHETCATNTNQAQMVIQSVIHMIVKANLKMTGI